MEIRFRIGNTTYKWSWESFLNSPAYAVLAFLVLIGLYVLGCWIESLM